MVISWCVREKKFEKEEEEEVHFLIAKSVGFSLPSQPQSIY
jgi:hypothetical protein